MCLGTYILRCSFNAGCQLVRNNYRREKSLWNEQPSCLHLSNCHCQHHISFEPMVWLVVCELSPFTKMAAVCTRERVKLMSCVLLVYLCVSLWLDHKDQTTELCVLKQELARKYHHLSLKETCITIKACTAWNVVGKKFSVV